MTAAPAGPDPAALVTDESVAAAVDVFLSGGSVRDMLEAVAKPIVAAWQHWEEGQAG
jgi:hypothetical protein